MNNNMTSAQLKAEIAKRSPWYQCIEFPSYGISTTDEIGNSFQDGAHDNLIGGISVSEASRLRPVPKWDFIRTVLPDVRGYDILEIGSNCGFFSFKFAELGARSVLGLDVAPKWLENAEWARSVLGYANVEFLNCDFMRFGGQATSEPGLLSRSDTTIPLPDRQFDLVFMSTVLDHLFFPLFAIYKMIRISRRWVIIDVPALVSVDNAPLAHLGVAADNSHHGFLFALSFLKTYISRLGIPEADVSTEPYNGNRNITYIIDVRRLNNSLVGA